MKKCIINLCLVTCILYVGGSFSPAAFAYTYNRELDKALKSMLKGDYHDAIDKCVYIENRSSQKSLKAEALYLKGTCFMKLEEYEKARNIFKKALSKTRGDLLTEIYIAIGDSYFMDKEYNKAISVYKQLADKADDKSNYLAGIYFKLGKSFQKKSQWAQSKYYFDILKRQFPDSLEAQLTKKLSVGGNFFTIQVGCFSNKKNAEKLQNDLSRKGYDVFLTPFKANGQQLYRVRVGEFVTRLAAEHTERELRTREHLPTHIFP